ncbi:MAG: glycine dehydrogenase (aminomethyl-transferring) [Deltaproteobacteria bacterium RBG_16_49_23]|nr:MAG: glycine dehydrogenase (aminomethyl-transferring) [Deltaproteobacteria bacterium RBG_16_49_23]
MEDYLRYIPHTEEDVRKMLQAIGVKRVEDLFETIPAEFRLSRPLNLPGPLSEPNLLRHLQGLESQRPPHFLGGGAYQHHIPAVVSHLASRSEFYTAYTPYQAEISQGTLQAVFEFQTLMCQLTGMEVSNGSMYDGASSLAEAVLMAHRITRRKKVLVSQAIHPEYRKVIQTYIDPEEQEILLIPYQKGEGRTDEDVLVKSLDQEVSAVVVQNPNFFGVVEDLQTIAERVHQEGGLMIAGFNEAIAYGILRSPGALGADIVAGEGQSLGIPLSFGGPYLGIFTTREQFIRNMPGRLVGETVDLEGKRGFVLTLAAREQHIRREKATSNICTNEGLCALMATIFLSCIGKHGLRELALMNLSKAEYAKKAASRIGGCRVAFSSPTFNEFVLEVDGAPEKILERMRTEGLLGGLDLSRFYPELDHHLVVTVTEMNTKEEIDHWAEALEKVLNPPLSPFSKGG